MLRDGDLISERRKWFRREPGGQRTIAMSYLHSASSASATEAKGFNW